MELDYKSLGLKCGIEIHQQLDTHKLFCSCPSVIRDDKPDFVIRRRMRAVAGEMGGVDPAALHEFLKNRELTYEAYSDTNCLVELDEEPPHIINGEALSTALTVALMLSAKPVSELQVMRKTVIDGSNTSGFQRTVLVAMNGVLKTSMGDVGIPTICLEEDAARIIEDKGDKVTYRLDRLGIPLVEIATDPDIKTPEHGREVAEKIGLLLRATGRVKRGLGTIRQDLNVSIRDGERIEVKGVQELRAIAKLIENEVRRQLVLVEVKRRLSERGVKPEEINEKCAEVTDCFAGDERAWIGRALKDGKKVFAISLKGFSGILGTELMPDYRFGTELSHVAKASAGVGGILHSDEDSNKAVSPALAGKLNLNEKDAWVAVVGEDVPRIKKAFSAIAARCRSALQGIPKETRRADGEKTAYMRPLPGSNRMYPETDEPLIPTAEMTIKIKGKIPKLPEEKIKDFKKLGLGDELASQLVHSPRADAFTKLTEKFRKVKPSVVAQTLLSTPKEAKKRYNAPTENLTEEHFEDILSAVDGGLITKDVIVEVVRYLSESPGKKVKEIIAEKNLSRISGKELQTLVSEVLKSNRGASENELLGKVMAQVGGRANPEEIRELVKRLA